MMLSLFSANVSELLGNARMTGFPALFSMLSIGADSFGLIGPIGFESSEHYRPDFLAGATR